MLRHRTRGWRYVPVHPFGDDSDLLSRIGWPAERCRTVDAYWEFGDDIYLLQVDAEGGGPRSRGLYYRWDGGDGYVANLVAVVDSEPIARNLFEALMDRFAGRLPLTGRAKSLTPLPGDR